MVSVRIAALVLVLAVSLSACAKGSPTQPLPGKVPESPAPQETATVTVEVAQQHDAEWRQVTPLNATSPPGPGALRLRFSKPVRRAEVEQALKATQPAPIRGLMQWIDDQTLVWQITAMPQRLDFLLGGAHDQDGLPLPGGIPSLRVGDPPTLVSLDVGTGQETVHTTLLPDILSSQITADGKSFNLQAWTPGSTPWDWRTAEYHLNLATPELQSGRIGEPQPRAPVSDLEGWEVSPAGNNVAGFRTDRSIKGPLKSDLVIMDLGGGRQRTIEGFVGRYDTPTAGDRTIQLVWSNDGLRIAALSYEGATPKESDLVLFNIRSGERLILIKGLPVPSFGTRLAWSPDGRFLLAGNLLVDLTTKAYQALEGAPATAQGFWEQGGQRLLYNGSDWGQVFVVDPPTGKVTPLGAGLVVGWTSGGRAFLIRWPASNTRYLPPGL